MSCIQCIQCILHVYVYVYPTADTVDSCRPCTCYCDVIANNNADIIVTCVISHLTAARPEVLLVT